MTDVSQAATLTWVHVPGGSSVMGSDDFYPDEAPQHIQHVAAFDMTASPVTNAQFAKFVAATGHVTIAERPLSAGDFPELSATERAAGSLVFTPTDGPVDLRDWQQWWRWVPGASWRSPTGPGSSIDDLPDHPVIQVAFADAFAFCEWAGARLPTEAEHEHASSGGVTPSPYAWGSERMPEDVLQANTWQGRFPYRNDGALGWSGTSPVGSFPANNYGLYDCIGNVWEWTSDLYSQDRTASAKLTQEQDNPCSCGPAAPKPTADLDASQVPRRVLKGGSHLCAPEYCLRYRPAARSAQAEDSATTHIGFRAVR